MGDEYSIWTAAEGSGPVTLFYLGGKFITIDREFSNQVVECK